MDESDDTECDLAPGPQVTPELFVKWRDARRGDFNGQPLTNPVWDWLIRTKLWPHGAGQHFGDTQPFPTLPRWCFSRFGMSQTLLPDGRQLFVAGEHEDHYDPDFFIYNDVIVRHPDDSIEVFGYSVDDFPPTDFHSATWVDGRLLLIGCLGYPEMRNPAVTPCLSLDVGSMRITPLQTTGTNPGWLYEHSAELAEGRILVRGGKVERKTILENVDDWELDLQTLRWSRLTDRQWPQLTFCRPDGKANRLWEIRSHLFDLQIAASGYEWPDSEQRLREASKSFAKDGIAIDRKEIDALYSPPIDHVAFLRKDREDFNVHRIQVGDVVVRFTEDTFSIDMVVEGKLPEATLAALIGDLCEKLGRLENAKYIAIRH